MPSCCPHTTHRLIPSLARVLWVSKSCLKECGFAEWLCGHWVPSGGNPTFSLAWPSRSFPSCVPHAASLTARCDRVYDAVRAIRSASAVSCSHHTVHAHNLASSQAESVAKERLGTDPSSETIGTVSAVLTGLTCVAQVLRVGPRTAGTGAPSPPSRARPGCKARPGPHH